MTRTPQGSTITRVKSQRVNESTSQESRATWNRQRQSSLPRDAPPMSTAMGTKQHQSYTSTGRYFSTNGSFEHSAPKTMYTTARSDQRASIARKDENAGTVPHYSIPARPKFQSELDRRLQPVVVIRRVQQMTQLQQPRRGGRYSPTSPPR